MNQEQINITGDAVSDEFTMSRKDFLRLLAAERTNEREACIQDVRSYNGIHVYDAMKIVEVIRARETESKEHFITDNFVSDSDDEDEDEDDSPLEDRLEWAEKGLAEWRNMALNNARQEKVARATARIAISYLQAVLAAHVHDSAASRAARVWLESIGEDVEENK